MNVGLQYYTIQKIIAFRDGDPDEFDEQYIDEQLHLNENIQALEDQGIIPKDRTPKKIEKELKEMEKQYEDYYKSLKSNLVTALTHPYYVCPICEYQTDCTSKMIQHFHDVHSLKEMPFITSKKDKQTPSYVILSHFVYLFSRTKKKTIKVSNKELYKCLKAELEIELSNQLPAHTLKLLRFRRYKDYDKTGARIYIITLRQLKEIVNKTNFDDLKYRLGLIDENKIIIKPKPLSPTSEDEHKEENDTEKTERFKPHDMDDFIL
jgi:hypothetical protein